MLWHKDDVLTSDRPQLELVFTLENTSDSVTQWAKSDLHVLRKDIHEVWTEPNSGLLLQAGFKQTSLDGNSCIEMVAVVLSLIVICGCCSSCSSCSSCCYYCCFGASSVSERFERPLEPCTW